MTSEKKLIVFLVGYSAAGKSTLAKAMRDNFGYFLIEHQPLIHKIAEKKGFLRARFWLAKAGAEQFAEESANEMIAQTKSAIDEGKTKIVFDIAYGLKMHKLFKNEFPDAIRLTVSVLSDDKIRAKNIQKRMGAESAEEAKEELNLRDDFFHQVGVENMIKRSEIEIVNEGKSVEEIAFELNELIEMHIQKEKIRITKAPYY
jgi:dephospho-CoA kinase